MLSTPLSIGSRPDIVLQHRERFLLLTLFLLLASEVFGGALRYLLSNASMTWMIYLPKILTAFFVFGMFVFDIYHGVLRRSLVLFLSIVCFLSIVGILFTNNISQVGFGFFVILPLLLGVVSVPALAKFSNRLLPYVIALWAAAAIGVIYDFYSELPWSGASYQIGDQELIVSRQWRTQEFDRIAGFSRASFAVADQLLIFATITIILSRDRLIPVVIWLMTGPLITLTTTKKTLLAYALLTLLAPMLSHWTSISFKIALRTLTPWFVVVTGMVLPLSTLFVNYSLDINSDIGVLLLNSFEDRLINTWPDTFKLLFEHGNAIFGRGIGGIGMAQFYFEPEIFSPADNFYLYIYFTSGLLCLPFLAFFARSLATLDIQHSSCAQLVWFLGVNALILGWASNDIEDVLISVSLGFAIGFLLHKKQYRESLIAFCGMPSGSIRSKLRSWRHHSQ